MGKARHGRCRRAIRPAVGSVGRPGVDLREERQRFWKAIAEGLPSESAAAIAGVSPAVGVRWFRQSGGMPDITLTPLSPHFASQSVRRLLFYTHRATAFVKSPDGSVGMLRRFRESCAAMPPLEAVTSSIERR